MNDKLFVQMKELILKNNFTLNETDAKDFSSYVCVRVILDNEKLIQMIFNETNLKLITIEDYVLFLFIRKISSMASWIKYVSEKEKSAFVSITSVAFKLSKKYNDRDVIKFVNNNYDKIMTMDCRLTNKNDCVIDNLDLLCDDVILWFIHNDLLLILQKPKLIENRIFKSIRLASSLCEQILKNDNYYNLEKICEPFITLPVINSDDMRKYISAIIEYVYSKSIEITKLIKNDLKGIFYYGSLSSGYKLLKKYGRDDLSPLKEIIENENYYVDDYLSNHGSVIYADLDLSKIASCISEDNLECFISYLTHRVENDKIISIFDYEPADSMINYFYSVNKESEYFTRQRQAEISRRFLYYSSFYYIVFNDINLKKKYIELRKKHIYKLSGVLSDQNFSEEINYLYDHLLEKSSLESMNFIDNYGICMYLFAMIEKILRLVCLKEMPNKVPDDKLSRLFECEQVVNVLGVHQSRSLSYLISKSNDIGCDYRNRLAHWMGVRIKEVDSILINEILFVFDSIINSITIYYL